LGQKLQRIKKRENFRTRLVNGAKNSCSALRKLLQGFNDGHGKVGVETGCGLVGEYDWRVDQDFGGDRESFHLAARDRLRQPFELVSTFLDP